MHENKNLGVQCLHKLIVWGWLNKGINALVLLNEIFWNELNFWNWIKKNIGLCALQEKYSPGDPLAYPVIIDKIEITKDVHNITSSSMFRQFCSNASPEEQESIDQRKYYSMS